MAYVLRMCLLRGVCTVVGRRPVIGKWSIMVCAARGMESEVFGTRPIL